MGKLKKSLRVLEEPIRLSESIVWSMQRDYYERQNVKAWIAGDVPYWITTNPVIGRAYARVLAGFLRDAMGRGRGRRGAMVDLRHPIYVLELGSGSGQLAWHLTRELDRAIAPLSLPTNPFRVVLSDFTEGNVRSWEANHAWRSRLEEGRVDFAVFDAESPQPLWLRHAGRHLDPDSLQNPLILVANYIFDTICHDAFRTRHGELAETRVALAYRGVGEPDSEDPKLFTKMKFQESPVPASLPYYGVRPWDRILEGYRRRLEEADFLMPIGALRCLRHFLELSRHRLLVLFGDKAYRNEEELERGLGPHITPHGSFSTMVNADAIGKYFEAMGGCVRHSRHHETTFGNSLFFIAGKRKKPPKMPEMEAAFDEIVEGYGPVEYVQIFEELLRRFKKPTLSTQIALLRLSHWDTEVFNALEEALEGRLKQANSEEQGDLIDALERVWDHYYPMDEPNEDQAFKLARLLYGLGAVRRAHALFEYSHRYCGDHYATLFNLGLCCARLGQTAKARKHYEACLALNPEYRPAHRELSQLPDPKT